MTIRELIVVMTRRWYAVVLVVLVAVAATSAFESSGGMYTTRTAVRFVIDEYATLLPDNGSRDEKVIEFAAMIATEINEGRPAVGYARADAPFYGAGVREGVLIALPNTGGQWQESHSEADIEIQIVGPTRAWVLERQQRLTARVRERAQQLQDDVGAPRDARITTSIAPLTARIEYVAPTRSSRFAAYGAMAVATVLVAGWAAVRVDRAVLAARGRRRERAMPGTTRGRAMRGIG